MGALLLRRLLLNSDRTFTRPRHRLRNRNPFVENISHVAARNLPLLPPSIGIYNSLILRNTGMTSEIRQNHQDLQDVTRLSDHVIRVLGQNPGKFTLQGTNTYLVGSQRPYIMVDCAEGSDSYIPILTSALQGGSTATSNTSAPDVSDIIISHWHHDHVGGLPSVLSLLKNLWVGRNRDREAEYQGPKLHKYPFDSKIKAGQHHGSHNLLPDIEKTLDKALYTVAPDDSVFHNLYDGQMFVDQGTTLLEVLHTPGHTIDSICLYLPLDRALYTADTVLGHGTAVFEDLATYMASLSKMLQYKRSASALPSTSSLSAPFPENQRETEVNSEYDILYPGHGAVLMNGQETIATYIKHRLEREAQIVQVLRLPVPVELQSETQDAGGRQWTIWNLVRNIYKSYPENLWLPATKSVYLHLKKLEGEGLVRCLGGEGKDTVWELVAIPPSSTTISNL
ncbi:Metallo-hydrolase/oxidoreductase [Phlegmacium glaucopus]|nr:Metallo-hydrolase/oxidoreductase [Phlegmacium glaucopus]